MKITVIAHWNQFSPITLGVNLFFSAHSLSFCCWFFSKRPLISGTTTFRSKLRGYLAEAQYASTTLVTPNYFEYYLPPHRRLATLLSGWRLLAVHIDGNGSNGTPAGKINKHSLILSLSPSQYYSRRSFFFMTPQHTTQTWAPAMAPNKNKKTRKS